jgi:hypothetical protein
MRSDILVHDKELFNSSSANWHLLWVRGGPVGKLIAHGRDNSKMDREHARRLDRLIGGVL